MALTVAVCVTGIVDSQVALETERGALAVDEAALPRVLNPTDANAIEAALTLRDAVPGSQVIAVSVGPDFQEVALREAVAEGVDEAVRMWDEDFTGPGSLLTARILAAAAAKMKPDIVICGEFSPDGSGGLTGAMLADLLGFPLVDRLIDATLDSDNEKTLLSERRGGAGSRVVEKTPLPLVAVVASGANIPRYPTLRSRLRSRSASILCWGAGELGIDRDQVAEAAAALRVMGLRRPAPDPRGLIDPGNDLSPEERYQMAVSGGVQERQGGLIEGSADELAERLARYLQPNLAV